VILLGSRGLLRLDREDPALGANSRELIREAWPSGSAAVCAIGFREVAMLARRGTVGLGHSPPSRRLDFLNAGLEEIVLDGAIAVAASRWEALHADPADCWIVATALALATPLLTTDKAGEVDSWAMLSHRLFGPVFQPGGASMHGAWGHRGLAVALWRCN
jgi:PIN domain nuclease of toxin-antitoxin system